MVDLEFLDPLFHGIRVPVSYIWRRDIGVLMGFCGVGGVLYFPFECLDLELYEDFFPCWVLFVSC
jgi:hypothetical protein